MTGEGVSMPQILGHNCDESLATSPSTGVASRATQLFAWRLLQEEVGRRTGPRIRAGEELTMTSHMLAPAPTFQSPSDEAVRP